MTWRLRGDRADRVQGRSGAVQHLGVMPVISGSFPSFPDVVLTWC